jgi:AsmA protein
MTGLSGNELFCLQLKGLTGGELVIGNSVYSITRTLDGEVALTGTKGALTGLNIEQLLRRLERRPLSGGNEFRSGRTPFDTLSVQVKVAKGQATIEEVTLRSAGVQLEIAGAASIPGRELDLKGVATLIATSSNDRKSFELPFVVQGPWDDPLMLPDAQILIQRSGAAAPLLDALRGRNEREAARPAVAAPAAPPAAFRETEAIAPPAAPQENEAAPAAAAPRTLEAAAPESPADKAPAEDKSASGRDSASEPVPAGPSAPPVEKPE